MKEGLKLIKDFLTEVFPMIVIVMLVITVAIALTVGLLSIVNTQPTTTIYQIQFNPQQFERFVNAVEKVHENN